MVHEQKGLKTSHVQGVLKCPSLLTFSLHAHGQALLVATILAAVPLPLIHHTVFAVPTGVGQVFAHRPLEEAFTALTAVDTVVFTWRMWEGQEENKRDDNMFQD